MNTFSLLIAGRLVPGETTLPIVNPSTGEPFVESPCASPEQVNQAVQAAGQALKTWRTAPFGARREVVLRILSVIEEQREELARLLALEAGKPPQAARGEVASTIEYFRYFTQLTLEPELVEDSAVRQVHIHRVPLGVVAAIVPWNFPLLLLAFKLPPALLAGNTIVVKPATTTPLTTLYLGQLISGLSPAGVVNIVAGTDDVGPQLTAHPGVNKISFTGSTATGKKVMGAASANVTRVTLELGGNDPAVVLEDVDVDKVASLIFGAAFGHSGQVCRAIKRVYAHESIYDGLCEALAVRARNAVVGGIDEEGVQFGPVQNQAQFARLKDLLADAQAHGTVLPGGGIVDRPGYFLRPTVVKGLSPDARLVQEEQFGPILPVIPFKTIEDAIAMANSGSYGLSASVWTRDIRRGYEVAADIEAGTVMINKHVDRIPHVPMAGAKQSGIGVELGELGLHEFTQLKVVNAAAGA